MGSQAMDSGLFCPLSLFKTRVVEYLDEPCCKLMFLVYSDFSVFTHVLVLVGA